MQEAKKVTFSRCAIVRRDLVFVSAQITELNRRDIDHTKVLRWKDGAFAHFMIDWACTAMSATCEPLTLLSMGIDGDIHFFQGTDKRIEKIDGPDTIGPLRDLRRIAGDYYAVGMQRQAYKRTPEGLWHSIADPIRNVRSIKSFESIDGFADSEIYSAGMDGEIWLFNGKSWQLLESPTSVALHRVHCGEDGKVYIVGQLGAVIVGRDEKWDFIDLGELRDDLWGVHHFAGRLYLASSKAVYVLHGEHLRKLDIGAEGTGCAAFLTAADGVMWSVGNRHLAYTDDGENWISVDYDDASY